MNLKIMYNIFRGEEIVSKETKIILDELNFSIGRINEREKSGKTIKESQYWYREGLKTARDIVLRVERLDDNRD